VLIDRVGVHDQQARLVGELVDRLRQYGVFADEYHYRGDPRVCRRKDPARTRLTLRDLAALHPDSHLLIFSDSSGLINHLTGRPEPWLELLSAWRSRTLLTPARPAEWGYQEWALAGLDFMLLPADEVGLASLVETTRPGIAPTADGNDPGPYPSLLRERPERWLESGGHPPDAVDELCEQLREYLGAEGYYWLCACAVYPLLQWDLTLYLGRMLLGGAGFEGRLLALVRLPWLRNGFIPDRLRGRLVADMSDEQA